MPSELFRIQPALPVQAMQTYGIASPRETHTRRASCAEVDCGAYAGGWVTTVDVGTDLGRRQASYIRLKSGRAFTASQAGTMVTFEFPGGQECFTGHRVSLDREPVMFKRGGDWRRMFGEPTIMRPPDWVEDFQENQQVIIDAKQRG